MTDYTITTDFGAKDSLPSGNAAKVIKGSEFTTEFTNILTAVNSKVDSAGDTFTGAVIFDADVTLNADVTFDTNTMFVDVSENRVGIGNVAPATALDVTGVITTDGLTSSAGIDVTGTVTASGLTVDTDTLYVDATNDRVGIGTTSPATALDVTGIVTADGLLVDGSGIFQGTSTQIDLIETDVTGNNTRLRQTVGDFFIQTVDNASANPVSRFNLDHATGDISFYEDTGTTPKFFWDASTERLGIGTSSPLGSFHVKNTSDNATPTSVSDSVLISHQSGSYTSGNYYGLLGWARANSNGTTLSAFIAPTMGDSGTYGDLTFGTGVTPIERMRIDSSGKVGIGTSSPSAKATIQDNDFARLDLNLSNATGTSIADIRGLVEGTEKWRIGKTASASDDFTINVGSTERMRIDASGNVGIGGAPAAVTHGPHLDLVGNRGTLTVGTGYFEDNGNTNFIGGARSLAFGSAGSSTERMRIDASGNVLVGTTDTSPFDNSANSSSDNGIALRSDGILAVAAYKSTANSGNVVTANRTGTDGPIIGLQKSGASVGSIGTTYQSGVRYMHIAGASTGIGFYSGGIFPCDGSGTFANNSKDLGSSTVKWDDVYATNGTIQTSDRNEKQDIAELSDAEQRVAVACKGLLRKFRWRYAVEEKGDEARIHFGIIAQDLQDAFTAEGLDAGDYAMFINSTWTDEETGEERSSMGVRYSELLAFIISAI